MIVDSMILIAAFLISSLAGITAGFFGTGSGLIAIPLLSKLLRLTDIPHEYSLHVAIGTAFTFCIILMSVAAITQHRKKTINWKLFWRLFYPMNLGIIIGGLYAHNLNNQNLHIVFGGFTICLAIWSIIPKNPNTPHWSTSSRYFLITGFIVGITCGITGMGVLSVPYLRKYGVALINAIATTQALGIATSIFGMFTYIFMGLGNKALPSSCIGYVDWQLLLPLVLGCMIFARFGVKVSHRMSPKTLNLLFSLFLAIIGSDMLLSA